MSTKSFRKVGGLKPSMNFFNLSYRKKFNCDMGKLIPVSCDEVLPGDVWKLANEMVIRFEPMVAPIMDGVNVKVRYFFVPYRLITQGKFSKGTEYDFDWENFLSQGSDGLDASEVLPRWYVSNNAKYSLWDYLGFPVGVTPNGAEPLDFPRQAYNLIFNEYFRNESIQDEVDLFNEEILNVNWDKDYFTSALLQQQRGIAPVLSGDILYFGDDGEYHKAYLYDLYKNTALEGETNVYEPGVLQASQTRDNERMKDTRATVKYSTYNYHLNAVVSGSLGGADSFVDGVGGIISPKSSMSPLVYGGFNIAQLRLTTQAQKWLERSNRGGNRYTELLRAHFGVYPRDERLDRPEYIGGSKSPVIISEVLQTSASDSVSPQGNQAGHGMSIDRNYVGKYRVKEYGLIMGLAYIVPEGSYSSQGINRQWLRRDRFDFYWPEFAHLSEQGIETAELMATDNEITNRRIFGYIGHMDEMRHKQDIVCADFRDTFDYWTLARKFADPPILNESFVQCVPPKRIFAVQSEPAIKVNFRNIIHAWRPMPVIAEPGLVDHF